MQLDQDPTWFGTSLAFFRSQCNVQVELEHWFHVWHANFLRFPHRNQYPLKKGMTTLMALADAPRHVGETVSFAAAVQQISTGKRALVAARQRVAVYHALLLADPSRQFFKLTCWGDALPTLPAADLAPQDAALCVGDIVLFVNCTVKAYCGNVEAQFSPSTSSARLLYRRERYFNTRDVRLKDLYPMIEWYRQHRDEFVLNHGGNARTLAAAGAATVTRIKDLRENMVATVVCKLRKPRGEDEPVSNRQSIPVGSRSSVNNNASELVGVLLCELVMTDAPNDSMVVNLWDQHADKRAVARLLRHAGAFRIVGIVIGLHSTSNRLVANTTDQTSIESLEVGDPDAVALEQRLGSGSLKPSAPQMPVVCSTIDDLEALSGEGRHVLRNVRVEQIHFDQCIGINGRVLPRLLLGLVEATCSNCGLALPATMSGDEETRISIRPCDNGCALRGAEPTWKYRTFHLTLRDERNQRIIVEVDDKAAVQLVGNIDAQMLVSGTATSRSKTMGNPKSAVAGMLNALVSSGDQAFDAEINSVVVASGGENDSNSLPSSMLQVYSHDPDSHHLRGRRQHILTALVPATLQMLPF